jgi:hypothetical protein
MYELGTGVFNWNRKERISDRYGLVKLFDKLSPTAREIALHQIKEGMYGRLVAIVRERRSSRHIGDFFHRVSPTTPQVGERVILGEGTLFFEDSGVGLLPLDGRETLWLDITALYRVHDQTVTLFFEDFSA